MSNIATTSPTTLVAQLEAAQAALGLSEQELSELVGFERPVILTLIKAGTMNFPLAKIPALAKALHLHAADLMRAALRESSPELLQVIEEVFNPLHLSAAEQNLIKHVRELSGGQAGAPIVFEGRGVIALVAV
ncbi:hypothetical protein HUU62_15335 [Rhodoferax sp. 4810]|nr:hypothetical protein [Rhodoferax jenense]